MPKEKTKIRVRIRKSRSGDPYSDVSYNAPSSMMFPGNQPTLLQRPAVRVGLLIGAAIIALIAAALIANPFASKDDEMIVQGDGAESGPLSFTQKENEALSAPATQATPSGSAVFANDGGELPSSDTKTTAPPVTGWEEPSAPQAVVQTPGATPALEALEAEEARKALKENEAEGMSAVREALTVPQSGESSSPEVEPPSLAQPSDVFAPQPSVTPEPPARQVPAPLQAPPEETADATIAPAPEAPSEEAAAATVEPPPEPMASDDELTADKPITSSAVARAQFALGIVEREPTDPIDSIFHASGKSTDKVYYFTELIGLTGEQITHQWEYEGEVMATVAFEVGGDRWRVYSSKTLLPSMTGQWRVVVVDAEGNALQSSEFTYAARDS